jgi:hypothetical protein
MGAESMRNARRWVYSLGFLVAGLASAGVSVEYASQTDFTRYRTFSFIEGTAAEDPRLETWLHEAVTRELRDKGLQMLAEGGDLLVRTHFKVREEQRLEVDILGEGSILEADTTKVTPGEYARDVGMGIVEVGLLDGYTRLQVWQGIVGAVTRTEVSKNSEKRINKAVGNLFKKYPPR